MQAGGISAHTPALFYVRERRDLTEALDVTPAFLRTKEGDEGTVIDYRNWQLALGRRFRSIKLWFVLRSYGVEGLQKHLRTVSRGLLWSNRETTGAYLSLLARRPRPHVGGGMWGLREASRIEGVATVSVQRIG